MKIPEDLRYTKEHEWVKIEGNRAYVGITDYAQESLGDIVYIEPPEVGLDVDLNQEITTIESVKAAEPIFSPLSGKIVEANDLNDSPESINQDPYGTIIFTVEFSNASEIDGLLEYAAYKKVVEEDKTES